MKSVLKTAPGIMEAVAGLELAWDHARMAGGQAGPQVAGEISSVAAADRCEVITDFRRLEELLTQWQRLWESDPRAEVFQTPQWARAWWNCYGQQVRLRCPVVFAGDEVVGILPLVEQDGVLRFLGTPEADYADVICEETRTAEVLQLALKALLESEGWSECAFHHLSKHSRMVRHYQQLPRQIRGQIHSLPAGSLQTIILRHQRDEVFKSLLGKHHTKRLQNKLRKAGELRFHLLDSSERIDPYLPEFFRQHVRRHLSVGRQSSFADRDFCSFIQNVIRELTPTGRVRFGVLELSGQPLAWNLGFEVNGKFLLYQHTFDLDRGEFTPGEVLLWNALEYAKDHVSREFDFGRGDELYKDRFTNYSRETFSLYLEPRGMKGQARGMARVAERVLAPAMNKLQQVAKSRRATLRAYRALRMQVMTSSCRLRLAKQNGKLLSGGFDVAKDLFRNSIWSRNTTDVFAAQTSQATQEQNSIYASVGENSGILDFEVRAAQLGDLVDLSAVHPEILGLHQLESCRRRIRSGDRVYLVRERSTSEAFKIASACWVSGIASKKSNPEENSADAEKTDAAPRLALSPNTPAMIVSEFWRARESNLAAAYRLLLATLAREAASRKADLLVHCSSAQMELRQQLGRQGFAPRFRSIQSKLFGGAGRELISAHPHYTGSSQPIPTKLNSD